jgi:hypothetical protein
MNEDNPGGQGRREFLKRAAMGAAFGGYFGAGGLAELFAFPRITGDVAHATLTQGRPFEMLVLGDSIMWGQGLKDEQKFSYKVEQWLRTNLPGSNVHRHVFAHSGARIKPDAVQDAKPPTHGEVPNHFPSITAQLANATNATFPLHAPLDPQSVALVLLDGGINDFGTKVILNLDPTVGRSWVRRKTRERCVDRMKGLLPQVLQAFPNAKVVVTNYFQIVSPQSDMAYLWELLRVWDVVGWAMNTMSSGLRGKLSDQSLAFHEESTTGFREAIREAQRATQIVSASDKLPVRTTTVPAARTKATTRATLPAGVITDLRLQPSRVALAEIPFGPQNAYGAPDTYLFYVNEPDPAASERKPMCVSQVPNVSPELPNCLVAASGHPNIRGANVYANASIAVLERYLPEWQQSYAATAQPPRPEPRPGPKRGVLRP